VHRDQRPFAFPHDRWPSARVAFSGRPENVDLLGLSSCFGALSLGTRGVPIENSIVSKLPLWQWQAWCGSVYDGSDMMPFYLGWA
jgi:hypothetical protein